jgi:hypothetical protein
MTGKMLEHYRQFYSGCSRDPRAVPKPRARLAGAFEAQLVTELSVAAEYSDPLAQLGHRVLQIIDTLSCVREHPVPALLLRTAKL